ncbi:MAG: hypothetical protein RI885_930 [Actinomycetota bacterium]
MSRSSPDEASAPGAHPAGMSAVHECLRRQADAPPPGRIAAFFGRSPLLRDCREWYRGAAGELSVATRLRELGEGWSVLRGLSPDADRASSDVTHLVIGPPGVFSITTVVADGRRVAVRAASTGVAPAGPTPTLPRLPSLVVGRRRTADVQRAHADAARAAATLTRIAGAPIEVIPVIVVVEASVVTGATASLGDITGETATGRPTKAHGAGPAAAHPTVEVLSVARLVRWLSLRPTALTSAAVVGVSTMAVTAGWRVLRPLSDDSERRQQRFERLQREVESAKRRRRAWIVGVSTILLAAVALGVLLTVGAVVGTVAALAAG